MGGRSEDRVSSEEEAEKVRDHFLGWQCRLRQISVREFGGRPTPGMMPEVYVGDGGEELGRVVVVMVRREPRESTAQISHIVRRTQDPAERYEKGIKFLQEAYYQRPREFSDELTALFGADSGVAGRLLGAGRCVLDFEQYGQRYRVPCGVRNLETRDPAYQATYWHNHLFNPAIPADVRILAFAPDWRRADASPPPPG
jgi:hypothetical protein